MEEGPAAEAAVVGTESSLHYDILTNTQTQAGWWAIIMHLYAAVTSAGMLSGWWGLWVHLAPHWRRVEGRRCAVLPSVSDMSHCLHITMATLYSRICF